MRKYIRNMLRSQAERENVKPSKYVSDEFNKIQGRKYGYERRVKNQIKGTHKRSTWKARLSK